MSTAAGGERQCSGCSNNLGEEAFSKKQWKEKAHSRKCKACVEGPEQTTNKAAGAGAGAGAGAAPAPKDSSDGKPGKSSNVEALGQKLDEEARGLLQKRLGGNVSSQGDVEDADEDDEDDPFVCDITGALISMRKDGRWHFNDGRGPEDDTAVCMSIYAYKNFGKLAKENPDTWEEEYGDKSKWVFIAPE